MCLAIPGKILSIEGEDPLQKIGKVDFGGIQKTVNLAYVPEAKIGDYVLVHVGFAISILNEAKAHQIFETLEQMNSLERAEP